MIDKDTLFKMLRPAGGGVHVVSTGVQETQALQKGSIRPMMHETSNGSGTMPSLLYRQRQPAS